MKRIIAVMLICLLAFSLTACPAGDPPPTGTSGTTATTTTTASKPSDPPAQPLTVSTDVAYTTVGKMLTFTAAGGEEGDYVFSLSNESAVSAKTQDGNKLTFRLAAEGELTVSVTRGTQSASCKVTVFSRNGANYSVLDPLIYYHGRIGAPSTSGNESNLQLRSVGNGFEVCFYGTALKMKLSSSGSRYSLLVDGETDPEKNILNCSTDGQNGVYTLASFDEPGVHRVKLLKRNQEDLGVDTLYGISVEGGGLIDPAPEYSLKIEVYGDSITCGHGAMRGTAADSMSLAVDNGLGTYAALAALELGAEFRVFSKSGLGLYTNPYGSTVWLKDIYNNVSVGKNEAYAAENYVPDVIFINIGTNDIWTGSNGSAGNVPFDATEYKNAYARFVRDLIARYEGKDIQFFACSGMMENGLAPLIRDVVATLQAEGVDIHAVELPRTTSNGHPLYEEHKAAAEVLVEAYDAANA